MKPRLPAAPWTLEDSNILWRLIVRGRWAKIYRVPLDYRKADRRDADIMLGLGYTVGDRTPSARLLEFWEPSDVARDAGLRMMQFEGTPGVQWRVNLSYFA